MQISNKAIQNIVNILEKNKLIDDLYFEKWGINCKNFTDKITDEKLHGGIYSKLKSIDNLDINSNTNILIIGPETGIELFLIAELTQKITVTDPDEDNLNLLNLISDKYKLQNNQYLSENIKFMNYGLFNERAVTLKEINIYKKIKSLYKHAIPTYYNVTSLNTLDKFSPSEFFDIIFIHKILYTITRFSNKSPRILYADALQILKNLLNKHGTVSWTEPEFVLNDKKIDNSYIKNVCTENKLKLNEIKYILPTTKETYIQYLYSNSK